MGPCSILTPTFGSASDCLRKTAAQDEVNKLVKDDCILSALPIFR